MTKGSLCAMGGLTPLPVRSALEHFPEDFGIAPTLTHGPTPTRLGHGSSGDRGTPTLRGKASRVR